MFYKTNMFYFQESGKSGIYFLIYSRHDIAEILIKLALDTNQSTIYGHFFLLLKWKEDDNIVVHFFSIEEPCATNNIYTVCNSL